MIHTYSDGHVCISSKQQWLPGCYENERAGRLAFQLSNATLQRLQDEANTAAGGTGGTVTYDAVITAYRAGERFNTPPVVGVFPKPEKSTE